MNILNPFTLLNLSFTTKSSDGKNSFNKKGKKTQDNY